MTGTPTPAPQPAAPAADPSAEPRYQVIMDQAMLDEWNAMQAQKAGAAQPQPGTPTPAPAPSGGTPAPAPVVQQQPQFAVPPGYVLVPQAQPATVQVDEQDEDAIAKQRDSKRKQFNRLADAIDEQVFAVDAEDWKPELGDQAVNVLKSFVSQNGLKSGAKHAPVRKGNKLVQLWNKVTGESANLPK
jgi:hypothetical protein